MRAVVVPRNGGPEVLEVQQLPDPRPAPGEVVIEVAASGVNFIDVYQRKGVYPIPTPFVLGSECAGTVRAVGAEVADVRVGDRVATADAHGSHATLCRAPADRVVLVPEAVAPETAAAVMLQGMTAHYLLNSTYPVTAGTKVLVHAAAGGVGQLLVQLAKAKGAFVVASVGSSAKADIAAERGADAVIRYDEVRNLAAAVREAAGGGMDSGRDGGVDVVYDGVGKATFDASLASLRRRGMLVLFGGASGQVPPFDLQRLNSGGSLFLTRPTLAHYTETLDEVRWRAGDLFASIADGSLRVSVGGRYALNDADEAYRALEGRRTTGKVLLVP
jgi:NADPH2:quinone reductase